MGLYLCVFDDVDNELEGVEVGSYADFNFFRDAVISSVEKGNTGAVCPVLNNHSDSDGEWTSKEAQCLLVELSKIAEVMCQYPPVEFNAEWKKKWPRHSELIRKHYWIVFLMLMGNLLLNA